MSEETPYPRVTPVDSQGNIIGSSTTGGSDASASKQQSQIDLETQIRDRLPSVLVGDRLKVDGSGVTQPVSATTLPLPTNAATDTMLQQVRDAIKAQIAIASTVFTDNSGAFYIRRDLINEGTGAITVTFTDPTGTVATPGAGLKPLATVDKDVITDFYDVTSSATGYSIGDLLSRVAILDANSSTPTATFIWLNLTVGTILGTAPIAANIEKANENVGARQIGNWNVGISQATIKSANTLATASDTAIVVTNRESGGFVGTATIQRAANVTPYTANDVYGAAFVLPNIVGVAGTNIILTSIDIIFNISTLPAGMGGFILYLYSVTPPSAIADNGAFSLASGDRASILTPTGIYLSAALATGGGSVVLQADNLNLQFQPTSTSLFGYLVTTGAFTPAANSETATIRARVLVA